MKLTVINKNFQLIASTKRNLRIAEEQIVQGIHLQRQLVILVMLLGLKITKPAKYIFQVQVMFV